MDVYGSRRIERSSDRANLFWAHSRAQFIPTTFFGVDALLPLALSTLPVLPIPRWLVAQHDVQDARSMACTYTFGGKYRLEQEIGYGGCGASLPYPLSPPAVFPSHDAFPETLA